MRIYRAKKPKLVCVFVWHLSLSRSETTCSEIGLVEKYPKLWMRKRRGKKIGLEELEEEISNMGTTCNLRLLLVCVVCVCIVLLLLSLSIFDFFSLSKPKSLLLFLLIHGFMGLIHGFMGSCNLSTFDSWVHGFDFFGFGLLMIFLSSWA